MLLAFLLLIITPLLGADEDRAPVPGVRQLHVTCSENEQNAHIKVSHGPISYTHSFSLNALRTMDKNQITIAVARLLTDAPMNEELSSPQKAVIALLAGDMWEVGKIVDFLFDHSRRTMVHFAVDSFFPHWGEAR